MNSDSSSSKANAVGLVSFQHRLKDPNRVETKQINEIAVLIRSGGNYGKLIDGIRRAKRDGNETAARELKGQLPAVLFAGNFRYANNSGLVQHSGLLVVDFDGVPESDLQRHKQELAVHPSTRLVFISPSGVGLKWVVAVNAHDEATHKRCFGLCLEEIAKRYPDLDRYVDLKGGDLSRRCFMSHDPEVVERDPTERVGHDSAPLAGCDIGTQLPMGYKRSKEGKEHGTCAVVPPTEGGSPSGAATLQDGLSLRARVEHLVAKQPGDNHFSLFRLARLCRDLETEGGLPRCQLPLEKRMEVFELWLSLTPNDFRRHDDGDYWDEFTRAFHGAEIGLNCVPWKLAWDRSKTEAPPDWAPSVIVYPAPKRSRMLSMLVIQGEMTGGQVIAPRHGIAQAARDEGYTDLDHPVKVQRVIDGLWPILELVSEGCQKSKLASVYRLKVPGVIPKPVKAGVASVCV